LIIVLLVEGKTETTLKEVLKKFLDDQATREGRPRVKVNTKPLDTRLLNPERVRDQVALSLRDQEVVCVVGLVDVYPRFRSAQEAKEFLRQAASGEPKFHAHAAQFEVEAWLLPFWQDICHKLRVQRQPPGANPEQVDLQTPPSRHLSELYRLANRSYDKPRDAKAILQGKDLTVVASQCPEFRALLNTLLMCAGLTTMP
jgi:hypothetical protein